MKMKTNDFIEKWSDLRNQKGYMQRVDPNHPLDFFVGINENGCDQLALFTVTEPFQMKSSKALEVEKNNRKDGKWATQISSVERKNQEIFARLCVDLVETSYKANSEQEGISKVTSRFLAWQRLFASIHEILPKSVLKGLVGEISFARHLIEKGVSKDDVLNAWMGPNGADRDFTFDSTWYEVKAIATGKDKVTISSLNQLETSDKGYLVICFVDDSSSTAPNAISIAQLINNMRDELSNAPEASRLFEEKLVDLGYIDKSAYESLYFSFNGIEYFEVDEKFPRLVSENVSSEIVGARYDLSLLGISPWKVGDINGVS